MAGPVAQADPAVTGSDTGLRYRVIENAVQRHCAETRANVAGIHARNLQHIGDQLLRRRQRAVGTGKQLAAVIRQIPRGERVQKQAAGIQWLHQVVAGSREEAGLAGTGCLQFHVQLLQLAIHHFQLGGAVRHLVLQRVADLGQLRERTLVIGNIGVSGYKPPAR